MHYEDLTIIGLNKSENYWYAKLADKNGSCFSFPIATSDVLEEELLENKIVVGKTFLGAVANNRLVALEGFNFIEAKSRHR